MKRLILRYISEDYDFQKDLAFGPWCFLKDQQKLFSLKKPCENDPYADFHEMKKDADLSQWWIKKKFRI